MTMDSAPSTRPDLLRVADARARLGVGNTKFYDLVRRGLIEIVKIDRATRVRAESIDRFIAMLPSNVTGNTNAL